MKIAIIEFLMLDFRYVQSAFANWKFIPLSNHFGAIMVNFRDNKVKS